MKKKSILLLAGCVLFSLPALAADPNADNTAKNQRDQSGETLTPIDQSNDPADIKLVAAIRKAVVADHSLSFDAKNVKIITSGGTVVLRGPVENIKEKAAIEKHAKSAGAAKIINEIEVKSN